MAFIMIALKECFWEQMPKCYKLKRHVLVLDMDHMHMHDDACYMHNYPITMHVDE